MFSQSLPSQDLGFLDSKADEVDIDIGAKTFSISQSPSLLHSSLSTGTTGAVLWKITPHIARWLSLAENPIRKSGLLSPHSNVIELGCGISGLIGLALAPDVGEYILTDQRYVSKLLQKNISANQANLRRALKQPLKAPVFKPLDWEVDSARNVVSNSNSESIKIDLVIACDCIYNEFLIRPFVDTCFDIAKLGLDGPDGRNRIPLVILIAQQLRSQEVFQMWLEALMERFQVWKLQDLCLTDELKDGSGYAVHVAMLKR